MGMGVDQNKNCRGLLHFVSTGYIPDNFLLEIRIILTYSHTNTPKIALGGLHSMLMPKV